MAEKNLMVRLLISAKDEASGVLSSFQAKAAAVATAIASYFAIDFLRGAISGAADFEAAMSRVQAATGASSAELKALKTAAEDASKNSAYSAVQSAQALEALAKAGLNTKESITALPSVMALAAAGDIELAQSAEIVTRTMAGLGIAADDTARIADVLAKGANASNTSVRGLAEALSYAAPVARSAGLSLEQTVAIIGKFADAGIDASRAGTALNAILTQFIDPASKFKSELSSLGINTRDFDKALQALAAAGEKGEKAILAVGTEAGPALRGLLNQGIPALTELKGQLEGAAGSAAATAETMQNNLNGALNQFSSAWDGVKNALGEPVLPVLTAAVRDLTSNFRGAVEDGTVGRYGTAIGSAFSAGIEWARKFAAEIDPVALAVKLQTTADNLGKWFDDMAAKARNAGDILATTWGVMTAGGNAVLGVIYKLGEVVSAITWGILQDLASISAALSKVTFGELSAGFAAAAKQLSEQAGAAASVAEAYGKKAEAAFADVVAGAELAARGWGNLTRPAEQAAEATRAVTRAADDMTRAVSSMGDAAVAAKDKAVAAAQAQTVASTQAQQAVKELRAEYEKLIAAGDAQGATEKLREINKETAALKFTVEDVAAAYRKFGLQSQKDLNDLAVEFKRHYEAIKSDGTATADILQKAFMQYAEKAIAANKGIVPSALQAEAAIRGVKFEADETGKMVAKIGNASNETKNRIRQNMEDAAQNIRTVRTEAEKLQDVLANVRSGLQSGSSGYSFDSLRKAGATASDLAGLGYTQREIEDYLLQNDKAAPGTVNRQVFTSSVDNYTLGIQQGLNADEAKKFAEIYAYYSAKANQDARGASAAAQGVGFGPEDYLSYVKQGIEQAAQEARRQVAAEARSNSTASAGSSGASTSHTLTLNVGGSSTSIGLSGAEEAQKLISALRVAGLAAK